MQNKGRNTDTTFSYKLFNNNYNNNNDNNNYYYLLA